MHASYYSIRQPLRSAVFMALCALALACSGPAGDSLPGPSEHGQESAESDGEIVARFDGGSISAERLNQAILGLPAQERPADAEGRDSWYRELVRQLAIYDLLVAEGRRDGVLSESEPAERVREGRKQVLVSAFLRREISLQPPTATEVDGYYEQHPDAFFRPERREVYHLFLRPEPGESRARLGVRLGELRARAVAGESFPVLAREHSQSQLRHGDGALGWISPGELAPRLNDIVFGLEEGVPSQVLMTESGAHIFLAATVVEERSASLQEARSQVRRLLQQELQNEAISEYLGSLPANPADFQPTAEELNALLAGRDANTLVLRVGDWTLTAGELLARRESERPRSAANAESPAFELLRSLARVERLFQLAQSSDVGDASELQEALVSVENSVLFPEMQRRLLLAEIAEDPTAAQTFFDQQSRRFAGPLRLKVSRLAITVGPGSGKTMKELEAAQRALASGEESLQALAERFGGEVSEPEWKTLAELQAAGGRTRGRLAMLPAGGFSEPVSNGRELEIFHVIERSEPEIPAYETVRDQVHLAYLQANGEELYKAFVDERLVAAEFEVLPAGLTRFAEQAVGILTAPRAGE